MRRSRCRHLQFFYDLLGHIPFCSALKDNPILRPASNPEDLRASLAEPEVAARNRADGKSPFTSGYSLFWRQFELDQTQHAGRQIMCHDPALRIRTSHAENPPVCRCSNIACHSNWRASSIACEPKETLRDPRNFKLRLPRHSKRI